LESILHSLAGPPRSLADLADLLEKHIGDGKNSARCDEALVALRRMRRGHPSYYVRAALRCLDRDDAPCELVRSVIATLRKWRFHSGVT